MIAWSRLAITVEAFDAIARTLPPGCVGYENKTNERGERYVWLDHSVLAPRDGTRGSGSGCDARRLSTGRSIRAWRTLCGRQMTRNAGQTLASEALVPWLGGPRSRRLSTRLSRSHRRVRRIAGRGVPPAPSGGSAGVLCCVFVVRSPAGLGRLLQQYQARCVVSRRQSCRRRRRRRDAETVPLGLASRQVAAVADVKTIRTVNWPAPKTAPHRKASQTSYSNLKARDI